jgi:hypothetical protein
MKYKTNTKDAREVTATMSLYEMCRWASLIDAVELVENKCTERKIDFETIDLQPLDILKYIDSRTDEVYYNALNQK